MWDGFRSSHWGDGVVSCKIKLIDEGTATNQQLYDIEQEYRDEENVKLSITEGKLYSCEAELECDDGEIREVESAFNIIVAKIDNKLYAFPADL